MLPLLLLAAAIPTWEKDIQPMFMQYCRGCHAATVTMGSLNLETYDGVLKGGNNGTIVVRGKPRESRLYTMLTGEHSPAMPMDGKLLPKDQVALVEKWIVAGALGPVEFQCDSILWNPDGESFSVNRRKKAEVSGEVRAISPDGKRTAIVDASRQLKVIEGGSAQNLPLQADWIGAMAFSADSSRLAVCRLNGSSEIYRMTP